MEAEDPPLASASVDIRGLLHNDNVHTSRQNCPIPMEWVLEIVEPQLRRNQCQVVEYRETFDYKGAFKAAITTNML